MAINLPSDWANRTPSQKIDWFNEKKVTPWQLEQAGVTKDEINWMSNNGYLATDPRVQDYLYKLPSQNIGKTLSKEDDVQIFEEVGTSGPYIYYQPYDAYGKKTGDPIAINANQQIGQDFVKAAVMFGSVVGAAPLSAAIAGAAPGLSTAAVQGLTGAAIGGGGTLLTGGSVKDAIRNALVAGGLSYGAASLADKLGTPTGKVETDKSLAFNDARQLADAGLSSSQIKDILNLSGYDNAVITRTFNVLGNVPGDTMLVTAPPVPPPPSAGTTAGVTGGLLASQPTTQAPVAALAPAPAPAPAPSQSVVVTAPPPATGLQYALANGMTATQYYQNIKNWFAANPNATQAQIQAQKDQYGVTDEDINTALNRNIEVTGPRPPAPPPVVIPPAPVTPGLLTPTTPTAPQVPGTGQNLEVVAERPKTPVIPFTPIEQPIIPAPITPTPIEIPKVVADKDKITAKDVINTIGAAATLAAAAGAAAGTDRPSFGVVPVPSDWRTPTYGGGAGQWPGLTPIDFGSRQLLRGTQWEKYLQPNQVSYVDLFKVLQGIPGQPVNINDVITRIQGQYGQTNPGAVGE